jgi:hypothetical protein
MSRVPPQQLVLAAVGAFLLAACGGDDDADPAPGSGGAGAAYTRGAITAKTASTVTVNGIVLSSISGTAVRVEGQGGGWDDLRPGMVVTVTGTFDDRTGTASEVEFEDVVSGRVDDKGGNVLSVGGQVVRIDDTTEFGEDNPDRLGGIAVGDRVRVSGVADDRGGLRASRIDDEDGTSEDFELKGFVSGLGASGFTLRVSPDASVAYVVTLAPGVALPAGLTDGSYVEVRSAGPIAAGALMATSVSLEDRHGGHHELEVEGIVTSGDSSAFMVDGHPVRTSATTRWQFGVPADLVPGVKVEVEGRLAADGVLDAAKVSFREVNRLQAAIAGFAPTGASSATLALLGVPVALGELVRYDDAFGAFGDGAVVELRGMPDRTGLGVVATRIRLRDDERVLLQGVATAADAAAGSVTVLGKTIRIDAGTELRDSRGTSGSEDDGPAMSRADFFAAIEAGRTVVKARGRDASSFSGSILTAEQVELEGDR